MINDISKEDLAEARRKAREEFASRSDLFKKEAKGHHVMVFESTPVRHRKGWLDCFEGLATRSQAIRAKCYECVKYEDVQNNVGGCTATTCPLWNFRPMQKRKDK